jgi:anti-sigma factor RsiW
VDAERLADYLAGELDPDEHRAVEAQLARDPALRARLQRIRDADDALAQLPPAAPAEGFDERLRAALAPELRRRLGEEAIVASGATTHDPGDGTDPVAAHPDVAAEDELSRRRERARARRAATWPRAVGGVAAGLALLGVAGVALLGLPGGGDEADAPVTEGADDLAAGDGGTGPVVVATDRDLGEGDVASLLDEPVLAALAGRDLDTAEGTALAEDFARVLGDDGELRSLAGPTSASGRGDATADAQQEAAPDPDGPPEAADDPVADAESALPAVRDLDDDERADVRRCLDTLLEGAQEPIPAYVEVTRYEGAPAIAFGLLTRGTDGRGYERLEVWVLERDDCQVRTLQQRDL